MVSGYKQEDYGDVVVEIKQTRVVQAMIVCHLHRKHQS